MAPESQIGVLVDAIPVLVWQAALDGAIEFFNKRWLEYTGLSLDGARGWKWTVAVHPDDKERLIQAWQVILESGEAGEEESRLRGADGQYRWFLLRCVPLCDAAGRLKGWCGTYTDIEDRKRIEEGLCRSNAILDETQRITHCGSMGLNFSTGEVFWSDEGARIFGFDPRDRPHVEIICQRIHPDDQWLCQRSVERVLRGEPDTDYDVRLVMPDGSIRHVRRLHPPSGSESPLGSVCAVMDVTDATQAEAALQEAQAELARVTRVTSLGELAASIAHEVLQPIAAITTNGEAALRWLSRPEPDIEEVRKPLQKIVKSARRAADIVNRVRTLSKRTEPERVVLDVNQMLQDVLVLIKSELMRQQISLRLELDSELPATRGDCVQLQQVVINLIMNGIQAMAPIDTARVLSLRSKKSAGDQILVEVEDRGGGIDPSIGNRVFSPLFTTKPGGMGMGLAICRSIIERHGGRLWFTRAEVGTVFHFTLPLG